MSSSSSTTRTSGEVGRGHGPMITCRPGSSGPGCGRPRAAASAGPSRRGGRPGTSSRPRRADRPGSAELLDHGLDRRVLVQFGRGLAGDLGPGAPAGPAGRSSAAAATSGCAARYCCRADARWSWGSFFRSAISAATSGWSARYCWTSCWTACRGQFAGAVVELGVGGGGGDDDERNGDRGGGDADAGEQGTDVHGDLLGVGR